MPDSATPSPLDDGTYDGFIIDVDELAEAMVRLDITILGGERKGDVIEIAVANLAADPLDLIGMPVTITVTGGHPTVSVDD